MLEGVEGLAEGEVGGLQEARDTALAAAVEFLLQQVFQEGFQGPRFALGGLQRLGDYRGGGGQA